MPLTKSFAVAFSIEIGSILYFGQIVQLRKHSSLLPFKWVLDFLAKNRFPKQPFHR
jgi:hypothetical protein